MMEKRKILSITLVLVLLLFTITPIRLASADQVLFFMDGFEDDQDFLLWSFFDVASGCTLEVTTDHPHQGLWAAHSITNQCNDTAYSATYFSGYGPEYGVDPLYVEASFYFTQLNLSDGMWIDLIDILGGPAGIDAWTYSTSVRVENNSGTLQWVLATIEDSITTWEYGSQTVETDQYYEIKTLRDIANGNQMLWINGTLEVSTETPITGPSWEVKVGIPWVGSPTHQETGRTNELYYDDVVVSKTETIFYAIINSDNYPISVLTNSTIQTFDFSQAEMSISLNVTGGPGTQGFCNVTFPAELLGGPFVALINGTQVPYTTTSNGTHTSIYITYSLSTNEIEIIGTTVIPEFPTIGAYLLFLAVITVAIIATKRKSNLVQIEKLKDT